MKLSAGDRAPDFSATDQNGHLRTLGSYRSEWLLLYFYPRDNTPGCTTEACVLRDNYEDLRKFVEIVGVSADSPASHAAFAGKHSLPFTLLSDPRKEIIKTYGTDGTFLAKRTSFLIDPDGIIKRVYEKVKPATHASELLDDFVAIMDDLSEHAGVV